MELTKDGRRRARINLIITAVIFIAIGLLLIGRNMGYIDPTLFGILFSWQSLLIVIGIWSLFRRQFTTSIILIGVGLFFLIPKMTDVGSDWVRTFWPLVFILIGVLLLVSLARRKRKRWQHPGIAPIERVQYSEKGYILSENAFGDVREIFLEPVFKGARINNRFGSTTLDLRRTALETPETYIDVDCSFGGINIFIPSSWLVITKISPFAAGVENKRYVDQELLDREHKLIIRGNLSFSGIEIKS